MPDREPIECVAFLLLQNGQVLAEKRKLDKRLDPGAVCLPGGKIEPGETPEIAVRREATEETGVSLKEIEFLCQLDHDSVDLLRISYFACTNWVGEIVALEAAELFWVPVDSNVFTFEIDHAAIRKWSDRHD